MNDIIRLYNSLLPRDEIELEARVCFSYTPGGKLVSNTNVYEFKAILNTMVTRAQPTKYYETVECHEFGRRITRDAGTMVQKKDNVSTCIHTTPHRFLKIKWSLNTEKSIANPSADLGNLQCIRKKNVHVFKVHSNWNMFLVEAYSKPNRLKTYEIELERSVSDALAASEIDMVNDLIYNLFRQRQEFKIVRQFNALFTDKRMHTVFFPINKPINLKFDMWSTIKSNYYYYPKLDGERFLIYTDLHYTYIFNDTSQIHVKGNGGEFPGGCVMDCEGMEGGAVYHVFDVLFWGGRDVRGENVGVRYNYLEKHAESFPPYVKLVTLYKQFDNTLWKIIQKSNTKSDGVIFTPRNETYKNSCTYKYKPPELLTIDFMIDVDDKLYAVDNASNYVLFQGSAEYPYIIDDAPIDYTGFEYQLYDIVEFNYDYKLQNFKPLRVRHDKVKPNHTSVALDVWYDIHHPIDIVSFVQNIS